MHSGARSGYARPGTARQDTDIALIRSRQGLDRQGVFRQYATGRGIAWQGYGFICAAYQGYAWHCVAGSGPIWLDMALQGMDTALISHGVAGRDSAGRCGARHATARLGEDYAG